MRSAGRDRPGCAASASPGSTGSTGFTGFIVGAGTAGCDSARDKARRGDGCRRPESGTGCNSGPGTGLCGHHSCAGCTGSTPSADRATGAD